jgi:hypothetical protein
MSLPRGLPERLSSMAARQSSSAKVRADFGTLLTTAAAQVAGIANQLQS